MNKNKVLGQLSVANFLNTYWGKKPLLIRQAIPNFQPVLSQKQLLSMASYPSVESRLITHFAKRWEMKNGPFEALPAVQKKNWTILFQDMNLHNIEADQLLRQFNFISDTRLDDLMISYASDGGGVGAHVDSYDVFLLQAYGKRCWRISTQTEFSWVEGLPLKLLRNFVPEQEYVLEPGDMLYLPPNVAHEGVAIGECMTYSIGFRAPSYQEIAEEFLHFVADSIELPGRYGDSAGFITRSKPAQLTKSMCIDVKNAINKIQFTDDDIALFLGEFFSEPKKSVFFELPKKYISITSFVKQSLKSGISLNLKTRMLYKSNYFFINGQRFDMDRAAGDIFRKFANQRYLLKEELKNLNADVYQIFYEFYQNGWVNLSLN